MVSTIMSSKAKKSTLNSLISISSIPLVIIASVLLFLCVQNGLSPKDASDTKASAQESTSNIVVCVGIVGKEPRLGCCWWVGLHHDYIGGIIRKSQREQGENKYNDWVHNEPQSNCPM